MGTGEAGYHCYDQRVRDKARPDVPPLSVL